MHHDNHQNNVPISDLVDFLGPQLADTPTEAPSVQRDTLNTLARTQPSLVASVLADWIDSHPASPR